MGQTAAHPWGYLICAGCRVAEPNHLHMWTMRSLFMGKMRDHLSRTEKYLEILFGIRTSCVCYICMKPMESVRADASQVIARRLSPPAATCPALARLVIPRRVSNGRGLRCIPPKMTRRPRKKNRRKDGRADRRREEDLQMQISPRLCQTSEFGHQLTLNTRVKHTFPYRMRMGLQQKCP